MQINLTQKERMLLEDQKAHEELCIEKYASYENQASDTQLKQILHANGEVEKQHLNTINQLLNGEVPDLNQQQNNNQQQTMVSNQNQTQVAISNVSDAEICKDLLKDEKYVSGAYDTAIFEFTNTNARDVLNHIQKEEQKHGEAIYQYMESKGMYKTQ